MLAVTGARPTYIPKNHLVLYIRYQAYRFVKEREYISGS